MPTIYDTIQDFQQRLLRDERRAAAQMVRVYAESWKRIRKKLERLQTEYERAQSQGQDVGMSWLYQNQRLSDMRQLVARELARFSSYASGSVSAQQARVISESLRFSRDMTVLSLGEEYDAQSRFAVRSLNTGAIAALVGATQAGSALDTLFRGIRAEGAQAAEDALVQGIVLGYNPRKIAPLIRDALGVQLNRALTISRTETMRAQRVAASESYKANADVMKGWRWQAALTGNTCPVCISMHGSIHPVEEEMESHPNCRCVMIPVTKSWEELGAELGVDFSGVEKAGPSFEEIAKKYKLTPEQRRTYANRKGSGEAYFRGLSAEEQIKILGPGRWTSWRSGIIQFDQISRKTWSAQWGAGRAPISLKELVGNTNAQQYRKLGSEYLRLLRTEKGAASAEAGEVAKSLLRQIQGVEPQMTTSLGKLVRDLDGHLAGLEFRTKSESSLARKITKLSQKRGITTADAAALIKDGLRYTAVFSEKDLVDKARNITASMAANGYSVKKIRNYFGSGSNYEGLHLVFSNGEVTFELQFHTEESYRIKSLNHYDYEVNRSWNVSKALKDLTDEWMIKQWEGFVRPSNYDYYNDWP